MLTRLPKAVRSWLATAVVGLYALCILLPAAALAFDEGHCLTEGHGFIQAHAQTPNAAHKHGSQEPASHEHSDHQHPGDTEHASVATTDSGNDAQSPAVKCCGLAFFAAVAPELGFTPVALISAGRQGFGIKQALAGLPPQKLIRPPKSLS